MTAPTVAEHFLAMGRMDASAERMTKAIDALAARLGVVEAQLYAAQTDASIARGAMRDLAERERDVERRLLRIEARDDAGSRKAGGR